MALVTTLISLLAPSICLFLAFPAINGVSFVFNGFNETALKLMDLQEAATPVENAIRLTNGANYLKGRAVYARQIRTKSADGETAVSFSTTFVISMVKYPGNTGGHGIGFLLTPFQSISGTALASQWLGLLNATAVGDARTHLFAIEFDTNADTKFKDPNDNHVGLDVNSLISNASATAGYYTDTGEFREVDLNGGANIQAWIDYNCTEKVLTVTVAPVGVSRPAKPLMTVRELDLAGVLTDAMYVGFSASTGDFIEDHYVLAWSFSTEGPASPLDTARLPTFRRAKSRHSGSKRALIAGTVVGSAAFLGFLAVVGFVWLRWRHRRHRLGYQEVEEWEKEFWPHRFLYKDLCMATSFFHDDNVLGAGGFGKVYRGRLKSGQEIAVKSITKEVAEGMKGFIAEVSSMGRLEHRNLVRLRGWCRQNQRLFIVYDYMPNGSLDRWIFHPADGNVLTWERRFGVVKDVTRALVYLHEEWEKRVLHRDIKSSNVMLDAKMTGRLGDFGLAKLYDHADKPQTTHVVGTLGYIAPELIRTGKATPASDVFGLGCVLLEVACGRRPVDPKAEDLSQMVLTEWLLELCADGLLLEAADPRLANQFPAEEMEMVLKVGLLCVDPNPERRPTARHVLKVLERETPLPEDEMSFDGRCSAGASSGVVESKRRERETSSWESKWSSLAASSDGQFDSV